jgi:hypothetical protein
MKKLIKYFILIVALAGIQSLSELKAAYNPLKNMYLFTRISSPINPDSVLVKNQGVFSRCKYQGDQYKLEDAVKFTLTVTNIGKVKIPNIQSSRAKDLHVFINGVEDLEIMITNFASNPSANNTIAPGLKDSFYLELQITGKYAINYGNEFTFQWEYMGIKSNIVKVNLLTKTFKDVDKHLVRKVVSSE